MQPDPHRAHGTPWAHPGGGPLAISGATLLDGTGGPPREDAVLLIEGGRIAGVGGPGMPLPQDLERIDAAGKFVIPGLMDAGVRLLGDTLPWTLIHHEERYEALVLEAAQIALASGVTTVFDLAGPRAAVARVKQSIASGEAPGARIHLAGHLLGTGGPLSEEGYPRAQEALFAPDIARVNALWEEGMGHQLLWLTPDEIRARLRDYIASGLDFVSFPIARPRPGPAPRILFSPRVLRAITDEAHAAGRPVRALAGCIEAIHLGIEAGVDLFLQLDVSGPEHPLPEATLDLLAERAIPGAFMAPLSESLLAWYRHKAEAHPEDPLYRLFLTCDANVRALLGTGIPVLLATGAGLFSASTRHSPEWLRVFREQDSMRLLGLAHFCWLEAMAEKGMAPMAVLCAATRNIARAFKVDKDLGTLEPGKVADLLILGRNPLASPHAYRSIDLILQGGRVVERASLPTQRVLSEAQAAGQGGGDQQ